MFISGIWRSKWRRKKKNITQEEILDSFFIQITILKKELNLSLEEILESDYQVIDSLLLGLSIYNDMKAKNMGDDKEKKVEYIECEDIFDF